MSFPGRRSLEKLGIINPSAVEPYATRVRDRADVQALICRQSGVIFLSSSEHIDRDYYSQKDHLEPLLVQGEATHPLEDDVRRAEQFRDRIAARDWLDVGTGTGALLDLLAPHARTVAAVEPNAAMQTTIRARGHAVYASIENLDSVRYGTATMFHVLEHLSDPVGFLAVIREKMRQHGELIVEVPHARDALLSLYQCKAFKEFTLWSEHLILHTQESLRAVMLAAGFSDVTIKGYQRYPLSNHLYWLAKGLPGGQRVWPEFDADGASSAYERVLISRDCSDTLLAFGRG